MTGVPRDHRRDLAGRIRSAVSDEGACIVVVSLTGSDAEELARDLELVADFTSRAWAHRPGLEIGGSYSLPFFL